MPSTTRSSTTSAIRFPSSKQSSKSSSSSSSKPDAITLLFRREVQSLLSTVPALPSHIPADTPVEVVACVERLSLSGIQQSVQLCQAGEETWVTRTEGARHYFPRAGRVQKRLRGNEEENEGEREEGEQELEREVEGNRNYAEAEGVTVRRKKSKKNHSRQESDNTPRTSSASSSSTRRQAPAAPRKEGKDEHRRKTRRQREARDHEAEDEFDDGASTETERSHLARTRGARHTGLTPIGEEAAEPAQLGRGQRRCAGRNPTPQESVNFQVKAEETDDLASLCGRVDGLEFRSTIDPDSECEKTPAPLDSRAKGKGRA